MRKLRRMKRMNHVNNMYGTLDDPVETSRSILSNIKMGL
jgi:hypothetical protein